MKKTLITLMALAGVAVADTTYTLELPVATETNTANGGTQKNATQALTSFANMADGAYMFNNGGVVGTNFATGEGYLMAGENGSNVLTLCPRGGAGGSGEVMVLGGASTIYGATVDSFTLSITSSASTDITGTVALTLAVVAKGDTGWAVLGDTATSTLTIGEGATLTLNLNDTHGIGADGLVWDHRDYKVIAMVDNTAKTLSGNNGKPYTLSGISVTANVTVIPEPATATLSLLALAGLAARRRRK